MAHVSHEVTGAAAHVEVAFPPPLRCEGLSTLETGTSKGALRMKATKKKNLVGMDRWHPQFAASVQDPAQGVAATVMRRHPRVQIVPLVANIQHRGQAQDDVRYIAVELPVVLRPWLYIKQKCGQEHFEL